MAGGPVAAAGVDLLEDGRSCRQPQPAPAIDLRNQAGEIAGLTKRLDERLRVFAQLVALAPVGAGKRAQSWRSASRIAW
jgi:hypothetical protein